MVPLYQQALSLYNQGDYEGAWRLLQNADLETEQEKKLFEECDKLVTEQAAYIIKSYIEEVKFQKAMEPCWVRGRRVISNLIFCR